MSKPLPLLRESELPSACSTGAPDDREPGFGALRTERGLLPLDSIDVLARIDGLLCRSTIRQVFVNSFDTPLEAAFIFPLPDRAAVTGFRMEVGGRLIEGQLHERGQAREQYEQAIAAGQRAAIAEEDRPGVFNLRVGNLMPGDRASVELTLCGVLPYTDGEVTFRFPLVVAPRYIPGTPLPGPSVGDGTAVDTTAVPDASRITPPVLLPGFASPVRLTLAVELHDENARVSDVRSSLHATAEEPGNGYRRIQVFPGERLDRDFILRFRLGDGTIRSTLTLHPDSSGKPEGTFALTIVPPIQTTENRSRPRALAFVLDRSGSMEGWKIVAARRAVARMIDTLLDCDRFCLIAFDNHPESPPGLPSGLVAATDQNRFRAVEFLASIGARGGTEMASPLKRAVDIVAECSAEEFDRVVVLVTDGQIGNEDQLLSTLGRSLKGTRIFTLGIDRAVNEGFLRRLAERGGGACEFVESEGRLDEVMESIHRRIGTPLLTGLHLESEHTTIEPGEIVPARLPDLFTGSPLLILGRYHGWPDAALRIHATDASGNSWTESVPATKRENPAIASAWARGQIRQLEDRYAAGDTDRARLEKMIVDISVRFHVLSRFTAYVAVDRSSVVNRGGALHQVVQPVEMPQGWEAPAGTTAPSLAYYVEGFSSLYVQPNTAELCDLLSAPAMSIKGRRDPRLVSPAASRARSASPPVEPAASAPASGSTAAPQALSQRFELGDAAGGGAMGRIYAGRDRLTGQPVLVKLNPRDRFSPEIFARWRKLNEALARIGHPALVPAVEMGFEADEFWQIVPVIPGKSLADRLRASGRMPFREAAALVAELAEALQLAHAHGLVHGDLKPPWIIVGDDGHPRLLDFGELPLRSSPESHAGTPAYMSPERLRGEVALTDPQIEVYALGVILYETLTGVLPFNGATAAELFAKVLNHTPKPPRKLVRSIPAALDAICLKAIAKDRAQRYATAGELAVALRGFLAPAPRKGFWRVT